MPKQDVQHPDKTGYTGAYSAGVACNGWLFVSGQGPTELTTGRIVAGGVAEQTRQTLANIEKILQAAGCSRADVVRCGCFLANIDDFETFDREYAAFFSEGVRPARTTVQAGLRGIQVEIDAVACIPGA